MLLGRVYDPLAKANTRRVRQKAKALSSDAEVDPKSRSEGRVETIAADRLLSLYVEQTVRTARSLWTRTVRAPREHTRSLCRTVRTVARVT